MIGEVVAVISALKALNEGIATIRETKNNAAGLQGLVGKYAGAQQQYNAVEKARAGRMSYKEALAMESAKRQLANFDRQFKDICLMQGQSDLYTSVHNRMREAQLQHDKQVARTRLKRKEFKRIISIGGTIFIIWIFVMVLFYYALQVFLM